jgi:hypothetical protein
MKKHWRTTLVAFGLLIIGLGLLVTGIIVEVLTLNGPRFFVYLILAFLCLIPGCKPRSKALIIMRHGATVNGEEQQAETNGEEQQ